MSRLVRSTEVKPLERGLHGVGAVLRPELLRRRASKIFKPDADHGLPVKQLSSRRVPTLC